MASVVEINPKAQLFLPQPREFQKRDLGTPEIASYLSFYNLPQAHFSYFSGYMPIGDHQIFVQQYLPDEKIGIRVFLSHGYCDHAGLFRNVIHLLLKNGVEVVTWDYPGFGMSSGRRGYTKSFEVYTNVLEHIAYRYWGESENIFIGHSAGCAYLMQPKQKWPERFNKVIFLAPLVRCVAWSYVKTIAPIARFFLRSTRREWKPSSADQKYIDFYRFEDPLVAKRVNISWPNAMLKWEKSLKDLKPISQEVVVFQGLLDATVDWRYNKEWLKNRFEGFIIYQYEQGFHHLQNESEILRQQFLQDLEREVLT